MTASGLACAILYNSVPSAIDSPARCEHLSKPHGLVVPERLHTLGYGSRRITVSKKTQARHAGRGRSQSNRSEFIYDHDLALRVALYLR